MKNKRILHVVYAMNAGGIESWLMSLYREIIGLGIQFDFLVNTTKESHFDDEIKSLGGNVIYGGKLSNPFDQYTRVSSLFKTKKYNAVHCHNIENATVILYAAKKAAIDSRIIQSHNDLTRKVKQNHLLKTLYLKFNLRLSFLFANKLLAVSKLAGISAFNQKSFYQISLGIDLKKFKTSNLSTICRKDFGLLGSEIVVGHVGRFDPQKNHLFFVDVAMEMLKLKPNIKFLFVGNGKLENDIKNKIKYNNVDDNFIFAGVRKDVPQIMSQIMDCFLFPSHFEGLGLVLVEAQTAGLPVICSNCLPEEATVIDKLVKRLDLKKKPVEWAKLTLAHLEKNKDFPRETAYELAYESKFNLKNTIDELQKIWNV